MVHVAREIINSPQLEDSDIGLVDVFQIPINESALLDMIDGAKRIITLEEHFLPGGLGSAVCEILNDNGVSIPVKRLGLDINAGYKHCYKYGGREIIRSCHGIDKSTLEQVFAEYFCTETESVAV
ncbi:MAG: transketolase C-terminal domain-containing protein, partial [Planctomycetota bacterium]|jgi:transketolase